jgi:hypothetical protein
MIGYPKPAASLSSGLLARKGQARPAMRPQGFLQLSQPGAQDDLGWNDMGDEPPAPVFVPVAAPVVAPVAIPAKPAVLRQIETLDAQLAEPRPAAEPVAVAEPLVEVAPEANPAPEPIPAAVPTAAARPAARAAVRQHKAAFTLRLDPDRHLRLRLASAVSHRSAQQLVTEALDAFLHAMTEVDTLARQLDPTDKD